MFGKIYNDVEEFYTTCSKFLEEYEAENNLIIGILEALRTDIQAYDPTIAPVMIVIFDKTEIVLVSLGTPPHNQIISYTENLSSIPVLIDFLIEQKVEVPGILGFKDGALLFADIWTKKRKKTKILNMNERIYKLEEVNPQTLGDNLFELATEENTDIMIQFAKNFAQDAFVNLPKDQIERHQKNMAHGMDKWIAEKLLYVLKVHNQIVSIVKASRNTPNGRAVTLVYTPPKFRRKGYATETVAKLCQSILNEEKMYCFLFTDLANPTSNKIYMNIGFKPILDVDEYRFE